MGKTHTADTKALISVAQQGNTQRSWGTTHTASSIELNRLNQPNRVSVFVYNLDNKLVGEFFTQVEAAKFLKLPRTTLRRYIDTG
jgi:hypothetical protein